MHSTDEFWKMLFNTLPTGNLLIGFSTSTFIGWKPIKSFVFFLSVLTMYRRPNETSRRSIVRRKFSSRQSVNQA